MPKSRRQLRAGNTTRDNLGNTLARDSGDGNSGRMTQWASTAGSNKQTGFLTWNPNGTLQTLAINEVPNSINTQTCNYGYEDLARLTSTNCGSGNWVQNF